MNKLPLFIKLNIIIGIVFLTLPNWVFAIQIYPTGQTEVAGESTNLFDVNLNTEGTTVNVVEGTIEINSTTPNNFQITQLILGGSDLTLWPNKPSLKNTPDKSTISFTGGVPGGISKSQALLFRIALKTKQAGSIIITPKQTVAFLNDGSGTKISSGTKNLTLTVTQTDDKAHDDFKNLISNDNTPPNPFDIQIGSDSALFDGKKFIAFTTTDAQSGISHYEIKEGDQGAVRSGSPYVLQDQTGNSKITVIAFDNAGNSTIATLTQTQSVWIKWLQRLGLIIATILLVIIIWKLFSLLRKRWKSRIK